MAFDKSERTGDANENTNSNLYETVRKFDREETKAFVSEVSERGERRVHEGGKRRGVLHRRGVGRGEGRRERGGSVERFVPSVN